MGAGQPQTAPERAFARLSDEDRRAYTVAGNAGGITNAEIQRRHPLINSNYAVTKLRKLCRAWVDETVLSRDEQVGRNVGASEEVPASLSTDPGASSEDGQGALVGERPQISGSGPSEEFDPAAVLAENARRYREKARRASTKRMQTIRFSAGPVMLVFLGDQHFGNSGTDVERAFAEQRLIMQTPGAYVWAMGDVVDNFIVGKLMAQNMKPSAPVWGQWQLARHYLSKFEDRLVAVVGGNHGAWSQMLTGIDYRRDVCPRGVLYDGDEIRATVSVGAGEVRVWARHQWRGSSIYNPTHGQERAARFQSQKYDLYVGAHVHKGAMYREFILDGTRKAAILSGAYKIHDDYARRIGFAAHDASTACALIIHDDGHYFGTADLMAASRYMQQVYRAAA